AANRRNHMRRVADEQQTRLIPARDAARLDREERKLLPILQRIYPVGQRGQRLGDGPAHGRQTGVVDALVRPLRDDVSHLPLLIAIEHDEDRPIVDYAHAALTILRAARQAEPED